MQLRNRTSACLLLTVGLFAHGCRRTPTTNWNTVQFEDAAGRKWSDLVLEGDPTSPERSFHARYALTEPELEVLSLRQAWEQGKISQWMRVAEYARLRGNVTFVRQVRSPGAGGMVRGKVTHQFIATTPPAHFFAGLINAIPKPNEPVFVQPNVYGNPINELQVDVPDGGHRGLFESQLPAPRRPTIDINAPDLEAQLKHALALRRAADEEAKWPREIRALPERDRAAAAARLDTMIAALKSTFGAPHEWEGTAQFPRTTLRLTVRSTLNLDPQTPRYSLLVLVVVRPDRKGSPMTVSGDIYSDPGADMFTYLLLHSSNWSEQKKQIIKEQMTTQPLETQEALSNCVVKILDANRIQLSAAGLPPTEFHRKS